MKYHTRTYLGPKIKKPLENVELCATVLCMVPWHWKSTYSINVGEAAVTNWKKLIDKLEQIEAGEAVTKEVLPSLVLVLGSLRGKLTKKHERSHCKWWKKILFSLKKSGDASNFYSKSWWRCNGYSYNEDIGNSMCTECMKTIYTTLIVHITILIVPMNRPFSSSLAINMDISYHHQTSNERYQVMESLTR